MSEPASTPNPLLASSLQKERITDSPWLWFALFTAVGLATLMAAGGKLNRLQSNIENKYEARAAVASGKIEIDQEGGRAAVHGAPEYSTPESTVISLWPIEIILGLLCAASVVLLVRQRLAPAAPNGKT